MFYNDGSTTEPAKYDFGLDTIYGTTEDFADAEGTTVKYDWYMPKESDADGETTATGDRWNKGDKVNVKMRSRYVAKEIATMDVLSEGRVTLTVGVGGRGGPPGGFGGENSLTSCCLDSTLLPDVINCM